MPKTIKQPECQFPNGDGKRISFVNRSGGALLKGGVYVQDLAQAQAESTTIGKGIDSVVAVATATMCNPVFVATTTTADNKRGELVGTFDEPVRMEVLVEGTTDILVGDPLKLVNGQAYLVKATIGTDHFNAIALEGFTTNGTGLIEVLFYSKRQF